MPICRDYSRRAPVRAPASRQCCSVDHRSSSDAQSRLRERGLEFLADERFQLPQLTAVRIPEGVDGREVQRRLLHEHGIEVGGALDPSVPVWRVGLMGVNGTREVAARVLEAFDAVLASSA